MKFAILKYNLFIPTEIYLISHLPISYSVETANTWEYQVANNANIENFVCL